MISRRLLPCFVLLVFPLAASAEPDTPGLSESALMTIRDGYSARVGAMFETAKGKPLVRRNIQAPIGDGRAKNVHAYAFSLTEYATAKLWLGEDVAGANSALVEIADRYLAHPDEVRDRDNFHWHSEMWLRLIELFGSSGRSVKGLVTPETETKMLEAVWLYCKRRQEDQGRYETLAVADRETSETWYIYESENHHSQSFCTQWNYAKLVRDRPGFKDRRYDDGRTAAEHYESWNAYLKLYFAQRARKGLLIEAMSQNYNQETLKGIFNIFDFAGDPELKRLAGLYLDLYFAYWGEEQLGGISGGAKSRIYVDIAPRPSQLGYVFFGIGRTPGFGSDLLSAMTTTYRPPLVDVDIACDVAGRGDYEVMQRPPGLAEPGQQSPPVYHMRTDYGGIARYAYCTPDFIMGTAMFEARPVTDWALISSQNGSHGVIFSGSDTAAILPQCEIANGRTAYNSQWSVQKKGTMISQKLKTNRGAGPTRVWFSSAGLSEPLEENGWIFTEAAGAYAAVRLASGGHHWQDVKSRGRWLYPDDEYSPVVLEVARKSRFKSFAGFRANVGGREISEENGKLTFTGIDGDHFVFPLDYEGKPTIDGQAVDYSPPMVFDSPFLQSKWDSGVVRIQKGERKLMLDFTNSGVID